MSTAAFAAAHPIGPIVLGVPVDTTYDPPKADPGTTVSMTGEVCNGPEGLIYFTKDIEGAPPYAATVELTGIEAAVNTFIVPDLPAGVWYPLVSCKETGPEPSSSVSPFTILIQSPDTATRPHRSSSDRPIPWAPLFLLGLVGAALLERRVRPGSRGA
jgi:hypothetical protein